MRPDVSCAQTTPPPLPRFALTARVSRAQQPAPGTLLAEETRPQPLTTASDARTAPRWLSQDGCPGPTRGFRCSDTFSPKREAPGLTAPWRGSWGCERGTSISDTEYGWPGGPQWTRLASGLSMASATPPRLETHQELGPPRKGITGCFSSKGRGIGTCG